MTGGSRGIGAVTAEHLARDGATVAVGYGSSPEKADAVVRKIEASGGQAAAFKADQAAPSAVAELVESVVKRFGRLDILVNNAGVFVPVVVGHPKADLAVLDREQAVNVGGVVAAVRAAVKHLPEGGRIITIGSVLAARVAFPGIAGYSASKAAVVGYTKGWARDLGAEGDHGQRRSARPDQHRHEPRRRRLRGGPEGPDRAGPVRQAGGVGGGGRLPRQPGGVLHHRGRARRGRRLRRLIGLASQWRNSPCMVL